MSQIPISNSGVEKNKKNKKKNKKIEKIWLKKFQKNGPKTKMELFVM